MVQNVSVQLNALARVLCGNYQISCISRSSHVTQQALNIPTDNEKKKRYASLFVTVIRAVDAETILLTVTASLL